MSNIFNSKKYISQTAGLTKAQADELYVNANGDVVNGSLIIVGSQEISGIATFDQIPAIKSSLTNADITQPNQLITKSYLDSSMSGVNNLFNSVNTWTNQNTFSHTVNLTGITNLSGTFNMNGLNSIGGSGTTFKLVPIFDINRESQMTNPLHIVSKGYVDNKFNTIKTLTNTYTAFNEFQGGIRCRYNWTSDDSGTTFTTIPKTDIDRSSSILSDNDFVTKKYSDSILGKNNVWTYINTFNSSLNVGNILSFNPSNLVFGQMPITNVDLTAQITDEKHFVVKKYVDDKINNKFSANNNFGSTTQTMYNNTVTNKLVVAYCMEAPLNGPVQFSYVPTLTGDFTTAINDDKQLVNKKYVDAKVFSSIPLTKTYSTKFSVNQQTSYIISGSNYIVSTPKISANGWDCYLDFKINENGRIFLSNMATISIEWSYYQSKQLPGTATKNADGTYTYTTEPLNANITPQFYTVPAYNSATPPGMNSTNYCTKSFTATYNIGTINDLIVLTPVYQSNIMYNGSKGNSGSATTITAPEKVKHTTLSAYPHPTEGNKFIIYDVYPLEFTYINKNRIKCNVKFPQLSNSPGHSNICAADNNPSITSWISSCSCSMTIIDSPFQQSDPNIISSCSSNPYFKNETGSAYFTLV